MPDVSIKPMITAAAPAASAPLNATSAVSPAGPAATSDAAPSEASERAPAEQTTTFANALQKQLDKSSKPGADNAQGEYREGAAAQVTPDVAAGVVTAAADLTSLLAGLLPIAVPSTAAPQVAPETVEPAAPPATPGTQLATGDSRSAPSLAALSMDATATPDAGKGEAKTTKLPLAVAAAAEQDSASAKPAVIAAFDKSAAETAARAVGDGKPNGNAELPETSPGYIDLQGDLHPAHSVVTGDRATPRIEFASVRVDTPIGAPGWREEVGQKVTWLIGRGEQRAELVLTPPHLGRVEVTVTVSNDQANALFVSANPAVRDALEQALPRLREVLADAGIALGQANVNAESSQGKRDGEASPRHPSLAGSDAPGVTARETVWVRRTVGLVDTFA